MSNDFRASSAPTRFAETNGRRLAYRSIGEGVPVVLCSRFRGTKDSWDPLFLDELGAHGFRVITFDYSGIGHSTGQPTYNPAALAKDALDLITALDLGPTALGGWSIGGIAAQIALAMKPNAISHLVLVASTPPGPLAKTGDKLFFELAKRENDFEDLVTLFFEPASDISRAAAAEHVARTRHRKADVTPEVPVQWAAAQFGDAPRNPAFDAPNVSRALETTNVPVFHLGADHDLICPVENWYALSRRLPTLHLLTLPQSGHGPHLQSPTLSARAIAAFVRGESSDHRVAA